MNERARRPVTFIVRVARDERGTLGGVVERVKTGAKERFQGSDALGAVIERMLGDKPRRSHEREPVRPDRVP